MKFAEFSGWSASVSGCVDGSKKNFKNFGFCSALPADLSGHIRGSSLVTRDPATKILNPNV